jgi:potassium-dependent mechanosensitive channel
MAVTRRYRGCLCPLASVACIWQCLEAGAAQCLRLAALLLLSSFPHAGSTLALRAQTPAKSLLAPLLGPTSQQQTVPATTQPAPAPASPADQAIPLPQIADRAEQLEALLREISDQLTPPAELAEADRAAKARSEEINQRAQQVENLLAGMPNSVEVRDEQLYWSSLRQQYTAQRKLLTARAASLQDQIRLLDAQQVQWQATWDEIHKTEGIEAVVERIRGELEAIRTTRSQAQEQLNLVLTLQNEVSQQDQQISTVIARIDEAQERLRGRLLERDSHPLWETREARKFDQPMTTLIRRSANREFTSAGDFLRAKAGRAVVVVVLYVLGLLAAFQLKRYACTATRPGVPAEASEIFARPFSVALVVALFGTIGQASAAPFSIAFVIYLLYLIPALRLLPPLINPGLLPFLYTLAAVYLLEGVQLMAQFPPVVKREIFALIVFSALVVFAWLTRPSRVRQLRMRCRSLRLLVVGVRAGLVLLVASLAANIFGFLALSQILGVATLLGAFVGAALYTAFRVLDLILTTVLYSDWARFLPEVRRQTIERWGPRLLAFGASLLWLDAALYLFTIHDSVVGALSSSLRYPIGFGRVHFTLGGVLSLLLIVVLGYVLANAVTLVLQKVLLSRLPLQRGLPYAISTVTYYLLLLLVFLVALTDAGVELNKFTVVTGALGVGVGFGLQNIVNNFVSGLILLFERPIRVGDTVEAGGVIGSVKRIGARSSTLQTFQGSEVIVPNSNLLSNQVINWTLSSPWRCVQIPVGVAYGTDPEPVLKRLVEVAESYPGVMRDPQPAAFFLGFGDNALNFELRFWAGQDTWFQLKSDVTTGVVRALRDAGIEIPFPQRDLHIRSIDASVREALASNDAPTASEVYSPASKPAGLTPQGLGPRSRVREEK